MLDKHTYKCEETLPDTKYVGPGFEKVPQDLRPKTVASPISGELATAAANALRSKEYAQVFNNPKMARKLWRNIGLAVAMRPASLPQVRYDKEGRPCFESLVEQYTYESLVKDADHLLFGESGPTELEMMLACQAVIARTNPTAFVAFMDHTGGKPVDETKADITASNPYETLTDEELEWLAERRKAKQLEEEAAMLPSVSEVNNKHE